MQNKFRLEIISPEKVVFSGDVEMVTLPSYEGDMSVLKEHISTITFLRPGKIKVEKSKENFEEFFAEDGTVEFFNNILVVLSASAINLKNLSKEFIEKLNKDAQSKLSEKNITDHERYILNRKLDVIKDIGV